MASLHPAASSFSGAFILVVVVVVRSGFGSHRRVAAMLQSDDGRRGAGRLGAGLEQQIATDGQEEEDE